jgi:molybdopterin/thiamine biosynthesis adenylyltransferase
MHNYTISTAAVLISGLGGLGFEVAKNVILRGGKSVCLHDEKAVTQMDLAAHYLSDKDVGRNRAQVSFTPLAELNNYVRVSTHAEELTPEFIENFQVCDFEINVLLLLKSVK